MQNNVIVNKDVSSKNISVNSDITIKGNINMNKNQVIFNTTPITVQITKLVPVKNQLLNLNELATKDPKNSTGMIPKIVNKTHYGGLYWNDNSIAYDNDNNLHFKSNSILLNEINSGYGIGFNLLNPKTNIYDGKISSKDKYSSSNYRYFY
jgi:hypothetical protein